ncbi:MAG: tRNA lysidine(34) synthetase TilS [Xanthomonadaceae bacterium]|nr:tRNA lysidine(34) synthetase TilS [Xanthomonadaceae bacterium]
MKRKVPGQLGGKLIRKVIAEFKNAGFSLPIDSHILCGVSGGSDSIALTHLITTYGHKIAPQGVTILHVNHAWRAGESDQDEEFVKELANKLGADFITRRLKRESQFTKGASPEERARTYRKEIFEKVSKESNNALVLTAHHQDDVAETVLWKLLTGAPSHEWGGINFRSGVECRPFINVTKKEIIQYLKEEKLTYRTDSTNSNPKYLRANMRKNIVPALDRVFPQWKARLARLTKGLSDTILPDELGCLLGLGAPKIRGNHWKEVQRQAQNGAKTSIDLPNGAKLTHNIKEGTWTLKPGKKEKHI